ncbi:MAG: hypothetical protein ABR969_05525 [Sedimentisphaerales bacterium]|jgi:hypothetical protein
MAKSNISQSKRYFIYGTIITIAFALTGYVISIFSGGKHVVISSDNNRQIFNIEKNEGTIKVYNNDGDSNYLYTKFIEHLTTQNIQLSNICEKQLNIIDNALINLSPREKLDRIKAVNDDILSKKYSYGYMLMIREGESNIVTLSMRKPTASVVIDASTAKIKEISMDKIYISPPAIYDINDKKVVVAKDDYDKFNNLPTVERGIYAEDIILYRKTNEPCLQTISYFLKSLLMDVEILYDKNDCIIVLFGFTDYSINKEYQKKSIISYFDPYKDKILSKYPLGYNIFIYNNVSRGSSGVIMSVEQCFTYETSKLNERYSIVWNSCDIFANDYECTPFLCLYDKLSESKIKLGSWEESFIFDEMKPLEYNINSNMKVCFDVIYKKGIVYVCIIGIKSSNK